MLNKTNFEHLGFIFSSSSIPQQRLRTRCAVNCVSPLLAGEDCKQGQSHVLANVNAETTKLCWSRDLIVPRESPKLTVLPTCVSGCLLAISPKEPSHACTLGIYGKKKGGGGEIALENASSPTGCSDSKKKLLCVVAENLF